MDDIKLIKKYYGEEMSHLCRTLFPTILEKPGLLFKIMSESFAYSKVLYSDLLEDDEYIEIFKNYIYSKVNLSNEVKLPVTKTPQELLKEKGYTLYECKTEADIQSFRHYYYRSDGTPTPKYVEGTIPDKYVMPEELCTFSGGRLVRAHVFFAVHESADRVQRQANPKRQDEYGISVLCIQFSRGKINTPSIKNRYNHAVKNPDATFENKLDNINTGLTEAFEREYGLNINTPKSEFSLPNYLIGEDGKLYRYNYEVNGIYYCPNNIIMDNYQPKQYDTSRYIILDYFVLDMQEKKIFAYDSEIEDSFLYGLDDIQSIEVINNKSDNTKDIIINKDIIITINKCNQIIKYKNPHLKHIDENFLVLNETIEEIDIPNVLAIDNNFLWRNKSLKNINLPNVKRIGRNFLEANEILEKVEIPNCILIGNDFLKSNKGIKEIDLPKVECIAGDFMYSNEELERISIPKLARVNDGFLCFNQKLKELEAPELREVGSSFIYHNKGLLKRVNAPKLKKIGPYFMHRNIQLEEIDLPSVEEIGDYFLFSNKDMHKINIPNCKEIGHAFLYQNDALTEIDLPNIKKIGSSFLRHNKVLIKINVPHVQTIEDYFLLNNQELKEFNAPELKIIGKDAFKNNDTVVIFMPVLIAVIDNLSTPATRLINEELNRKLEDYHDTPVAAGK